MQRNTNTNDSAIRDVLFSPRAVKRHRRETLAHATTTTTQTQTETIIEEKEEEQEDTCAICMDVTSKTKNVSVTECGHRFCTSCLLKSLQTKNTCPMCRAEIEPARKPNLEQLTANVAADLIQAEERDIDIHRRIALIGAFSDPRGRGDMILSLCREFAFGVSHSIAGWQGTDDQTYHASWADYEYNNYDDETEDEDEDDEDEDEDEDGSDDGSDGDDDDNDDNDNGNEDNDDTEKRDEIDPPPSWDEVFSATPATAESATRSAIQQIMYFQRRASQSMTQSTATTTSQLTATSQSTMSQSSSIRALMHNVISGVVSYTMIYTFLHIAESSFWSH
jgi:hypothetical protein